MAVELRGHLRFLQQPILEQQRLGQSHPAPGQGLRLGLASSIKGVNLACLVGAVLASGASLLVAALRWVRLGPAYQGQVVVHDGLTEGELLITLGYQQVDHGTPVRLTNASSLVLAGDEE